MLEDKRTTTVSLKLVAAAVVLLCWKVAGVGGDCGGVSCNAGTQPKLNPTCMTACVEADCCVGQCAGTCSAGYNETSQPTCTMLSCGADHSLCCEPNFCTTPSSTSIPDSDPTDCNSKRTSQTCDFCSPGYTPSTSITLLCDLAGAYNIPPTLTCTPNTCSTETSNTPGYDSVGCAGVVTGGYCDPCATGYTLTPPGLSVVCDGGGGYSAVGVLCEANSCTTPVGVVVDSDFTGCNMVVTGVGCDPCKVGYSPNPGGFSPVCSASGGYSVGFVCEANSCDMADVGPTSYTNCNTKTTGMSCVPQCGTGYYLVGTISLTCADDGSFDTSTASCEGYTCNSTANTMIDPHITDPDECVGMSSGETCSISCRPGYASTPFEINCHGSFELDISHVICTPYQCTAPTDPQPYTDYTQCLTNKTGELCHPTCDTGYTLIGRVNLICDISGGFSTSGAVCIPNQCSTPTPTTSDPNMDYTLCTGYSTGHRCPTTCSEGYLPNGNLALICDATGGYDASSRICTAVQCTGGPLNIGTDPHATYTNCAQGYTGENCEPECEEGWAVSGGITLTCHPTPSGSVFDASGATCDSNECFTPVNPVVEVDYSKCGGMRSGEVCTPSCPVGYVIDESIALRCSLGTGLYNTNGVKCEPLPCLLGPDNSTADPLATYTTCETLRTGDSCVPSCTPGYSLEPSMGFSLLCDASPFDASNANCVPNFCKMGPTVPDPHADYSSCSMLETGDVCFPVCAEGYTLVGNVTMRCTNGWYDARTAKCSANLCTGGPPRPHMVYSHCDNLHTGQICTPYCDTGYGLVGGEEVVMVCQLGGGYNLPPTCEANSCRGGPYWDGGDPGPFIDGVRVADYTHCEEMVTGTRCEPLCRAGYTLTNFFELNCDDNSNFRVSHDVTCTPNTCRNGPRETTASNHANYTPCNHLHTDQICYPKCDRYYHPTIDSGFNLVCDELHGYDAASVTCEPNTCTVAAPESTHEHTIYNCSHAVTDEICEIVCETGYVIDIGLKMQCEVDGGYEAWGVQCVEKICVKGEKVVDHVCVTCPYGMTTVRENTAAGGNVPCVEIKKLEAKNFQMGRLAVLARVGCDSDEHQAEELDWQLHPAQLDVGSGYYKSYVGAIIFNIAILTAFHLLLSVIGIFLARAHESTYADALSILRIPSLNTLTYAFLLPGLALSSGRIIFDPHRCESWEIAVASIGVVFIVVTQVWCWWWLRDTLGESCLVPLEGKLPMRDFVLGKDAWEDIDPGSGYVGRYGVLFDAYKEKCLRFILVEQGMTIAVSFLASPESTNEVFCSARNWGMVVSMLIFLITLVATKPFISPLCNFLMIISAVLQLTGLLAMSVGFERGVSNSIWMYDLADMTLSISAFSGFIKTAYDGVLLFYNVCMGDLANELKTEKEMLKSEKSRLEALRDRLDAGGDPYDEEEDTTTKKIEDPIPAMSSSALPPYNGNPLKTRQKTVNLQHSLVDTADLENLRAEVAKLQSDLNARRQHRRQPRPIEEAPFGSSDHPWTKWDPGPGVKPSRPLGVLGSPFSLGKKYPSLTCPSGGLSDTMTPLVSVMPTPFTSSVNSEKAAEL